MMGFTAPRPRALPREKTPILLGWSLGPQLIHRNVQAAAFDAMEAEIIRTAPERFADF
jgi:hypothetical protein